MWSYLLDDLLVEAVFELRILGRIFGDEINKKLGYIFSFFGENKKMNKYLSKNKNHCFSLELLTI